MTQGAFRTLRVEHDTHYVYGAPVELAHHVAYLRPLHDERQRLSAFALTIDPPPSHRSSGTDVFGNTRQFFTATAPHRELRVHAASRVAIASRLGPAFDPASTLPWEAVRERLRYVAAARLEPACEFCVPSPFVPRLPALADYALPSFAPGRPIADAAIDLMRRVHADFRYQTAATAVDTPLAVAFERRVGVCQDFSHVLLGALRALGLAARYVSGYLLTAAAGEPGAMAGADASHAWVGVWCPGVGGPAGAWLDVDPTNDCLVSTRHVRLAVGRDYGDVTPLRGVIRGGGTHTLAVRVGTTVDDEVAPAHVNGA